MYTNSDNFKLVLYSLENTVPFLWGKKSFPNDKTDDYYPDLSNWFSSELKTFQIWVINTTCIKCSYSKRSPSIPDSFKKTYNKDYHLHSWDIPKV